MLGLFGTLSMATRSLSTQREGTEVAGHNLANVNNPAYARQRLNISSTLPVPSQSLGPQGTGAEGVSITRIRNLLIDDQILSETSVLGSLNSQQKALEYAQANLGQVIDRQASGALGTAAAGGVGGQHGLAEQLTSFFNAAQSLSTNPTSTAERQVLILKAQDLSTQFNQVSRRLGDVNDIINGSIESDVSSANTLISEIANLNDQIVRIEVSGGVANDLRDTRQQRLEDLGKLVRISTSELPTGAIDVSIDGVAMTAASAQIDELETFDPGNGQWQIRAKNAGNVLNPTGGSIHGNLEVRDGLLSSLRTEIHTLATQLISEVNAVHSGGFALDGTTGADFFTGTDASDIQVNAALVTNPQKIQASAVAGAVGDNQVILALAQLADKPIAGLGNQTFSENYGQSVAWVGQALSSVNTQIDNQTIVDNMLKRQRDSISGVSLDEEMTDLIRYQRAFEASARLVSLIDELLDTVVNMKR